MFTQRSSDLFYGSVPALLLCLPGLTLCNCTQRTSENQVCSVVRVPLGQPTAVTIAGVGKLSFLTSSKTKSLCSGASCRIRLSLEHLQKFPPAQLLLVCPAFLTLLQFSAWKDFLIKSLTHKSLSQVHTGGGYLMFEVTFFPKDQGHQYLQHMYDWHTPWEALATEPMVCQYTVWQEAWDT